MNPFTGGCHYDERCGRWASGCGACPQLGSADPADLSRQIWWRKEAAFGQLGDRRLHVVANNEWMAAQARRSPLLGRFPLSVIPNGLNSDTFAPRDRAFARDVLGIPQDARVVLFVAMATTNHRKGFSLLVQALGAMRDEVPGLFLLSLGRARTMPEVQVPHLALGEIKQERLLSLIYSAADLFAIPSLQDNQPNTVLEALACGVPVVGFDAGGIGEMVRPGLTGELVPVGDVSALREATAALLLDDGRRRALGAGARETALREYRQEQQVERYCQLYDELHARAPGFLAPPAGAAG
jgi:glycosyltransferase involved in cell wall biosynthesis